MKMAIVKDAEYYRNYRARKKAERMAAMQPRPLFATTGNDDLPPQPAVKRQEKVVQPEVKPSELSSMQMQPAENKEIATEVQRLQNKISEFYTFAQRLEEKMGKIIEFPGLQDFLKWEKEMEQLEQKEQMENAAEILRLQQELKRATDETTATKEQMHRLCNEMKEATTTKNDELSQLRNEIEELKSATNKVTASTSEPATKFSFPEISLKNAIQCILLLIFLGANTAFLVSEQHNLYKTFGYDTPMAIAIAILTEVAVVLLSYFACTVESKKWKTGLYAGLVFAVIVLHGLVTTGAKDKGSEQISNQEEVVRLKKRLATFESLEDQALARINNIDKLKYPTLIASLTAKLNKPGPEGYSHKISELRSELRNVGQTSGAQLISDKTNILVRQREMALMLNLVFAHLLGFLLMRKKEA